MTNAFASFDIMLSIGPCRTNNEPGESPARSRLGLGTGDYDPPAFLGVEVWRFPPFV